MPDIQHSIQIDGPPESVYPLFSTAEGLAQWWAADITASAGALDLGFFNRSTVYRLRPILQQPPLRASWQCESGAEWTGTILAFQLQANGSGTLLRFTHGGWPAHTDYFVACTTTWGELMYRLKSAAEGKSRGPLFLPGSLAY